MPNQPAEAIESCPWCQSVKVGLNRLRVGYPMRAECYLRCAGCQSRGPQTGSTKLAISEWNRVARIVKEHNDADQG